MADEDLTPRRGLERPEGFAALSLAGRPAVLAASGIGRMFSCHAKRIEEWGEWMREKLLLFHPHLHFLVTEGGVDEAALRLYS